MFAVAQSNAGASAFTRLLARLCIIPLELAIAVAGVLLASAAAAAFHELLAEMAFVAAAAILGLLELFRLWSVHLDLWFDWRRGASLSRLAVTALQGGISHLVSAFCIFAANAVAHWSGASEAMLPLATLVGFGVALGINHLQGSIDGFGPVPEPEVLRGTLLLNEDEVNRRASHLCNGQDAWQIWWSGRKLPWNSEGHFLVNGASGSGKTLTFRLMMQSVLPRLLTLADGRAVVYDAKQDMYSILCGMGIPHDRIVVLNPFDSRSVGWDLARDITTPAIANEVASILIPEREHDQNPFFVQAARALLGGAMSALVLKVPERWHFRDVINILYDLDLLKRVLGGSKYTRHLVDTFLDEADEKVAHNIRATVLANLDLLSPIAAIWSKSPAFSLRDWTERNQILVLGNSETLRASVEAVNRVLFHRLTELVLDQPESDTRRTFFFLDELKEAGRLDGLPSLIVKGRSKGVRVAIGFQDIEGLSVAYKSRERAREIVGLCANKAFLRLDSEETARWASQAMGEAMIREYIENISRKTGDPNVSIQISQSIQQRAAVLSAELMRLPVVKKGVFHGYYVTPQIGTYRACVDIRPSLKPCAAVDNLVLRPKEHQLLEPWNDIDAKRLSLASGRGHEAARPTLDGLGRITLRRT